MRREYQKIRWREVTYEGHHDPIVSNPVFEMAQQVLAARREESSGRRFRNGSERLLSGIIQCAKCGSHMFGTSGTKKGARISYHACSKRTNHHECDQEFVRAERLEQAIVEDVKSILRDENLIARIWEVANKRLTAEKPDLEKEIARIDGQLAKTRGAVDRYFEAFEAGTLKAELSNEKVAGLRARLKEMEADERLELPAIDREMLASLVDNFENVMAEGPNPKKKHLLHLLVKKVLIHSRKTVEIGYVLPNSQRFANCKIWLPVVDAYRTFRSTALPTTDSDLWDRL